jgi:enoyl-CoA hydratase/carnithine racemase
MPELAHYSSTQDDGPARLAVITLDSPKNRNALSRQLISELRQHLRTAEKDKDVQAVVIESAGEVFCSGADLKEASAEGMAASSTELVALQRQIVAHHKPVITKIRGPVRAGGLGIVAASDIAISSEDATFAFTESRLGLAPAVRSLTVVPRLSSRSASLNFLTAGIVDGRTAEAQGLVTLAVPDRELDDAVAGVLEDVLHGSPQGIRESKALLAAPLLQHIDDLGDAMAELSAHLFASDAAREAMTAFLKR